MLPATYYVMQTFVSFRGQHMLVANSEIQSFSVFLDVSCYC